MKYSGTIEQMKGIEKIIRDTKLFYVADQTGWKGQFGIPSTTHRTIKLMFADRTSQRVFYPISFNYQERDNYAELWVKDEDTGRLFKVFPGIMPLFGQLKQVLLAPEQVE